MKKLFKLITNWKYTWFAWIITIFYRGIAYGQMRGAGAIFIVAESIIGALLMADGKWWGCLVSSMFGIRGIAEYYYKLHTMELIKVDTRPLDLYTIAIYAFMGWLCYKENKGKLK